MFNRNKNIPENPIERMRWERKKREALKNKILSILSVVIVLYSWLCGVAHVLEQYGGYAAFLYFLIFAWAVGYDGGEFEKLKREKERLQEENQFLHDRIDELERNSSDVVQCIQTEI